MKGIYLRLVILSAVCVISLNGFAAERLFTEYDYDQIGNTTSVSQDLSASAPSIDSLLPNVVRQNQVVQVVMQGNGLRGAKLSHADGFFSFSNIESSNVELRFSMTVSRDASEGPSQVLVSTALGTTLASFEVLTELPDLRIAPIPIVIKTGSTLNLELSLSKEDSVDHDVIVESDDAGIASVNVREVTIFQGEIQSGQSLQLLANAAGRARLSFQSATLGDYSYQLTITDDEYPLVPGEQEIIYGSRVGVNKLFKAQPPDLVEIGPIFSEVKINKLFDDNTTPSQNSAFANEVGLLKGAMFDRVNPNAIGAGAVNQAVEVSGSGLQSVDTVTVQPETGVSVHDVVVDSSGESVTFQLDVEKGTVFSKRQLSLSALGSRIPSRTQLTDRIYVGGLLPVVNSTAPIYFNRGDVKRVRVLGQNFESVRSIRFDNQDGLAFSEPTVNAQGTELTFELQIIGFARLGPRVLTLESALGDGAPVNVDATVIHIEDRPPKIITPVVSQAVGINKGFDITPPPPLEDTAYSGLVGIQRGAILESLAPKSRSQGSSVILSLQGMGLDSVATVEFLPNDGITVGDYMPSVDGTSATLQIDIAEDADLGIRQIQFSNGISLLKAQSGADRFDVTLPQPEIASILPLQIEQGATGLPLLIRGQRLNEASAVTITPSDGVVITNVSSNIEGTLVTANADVSASAATGPRVVTLTTPGGSTDISAMVTNTIQIVQKITGTVTPVVSASVGINKETATVVITEERNTVSAGVGLLKETTPEVVESGQFAASQLVGVTRGPIAEQITSPNIAIGSAGQTIVVTGRHLDDVTIVRMVPIDGVALHGPAIIANDGRSITLTADVANDADQTLRRLQLETPTGNIPFESLDKSLIRITGLEPEVNSIDPIQEVRGASFVMTIRGINFVGVQSVQATPSAGITFGTPSVSNDGRTLTALVFIDATAETQSKVISVITNAGESGTSSKPSNTFSVISE